MENNIKKSRVFISIIFVILFISSFLLYNYKFGSKEETKIKNESNVKLLDNYNRFFTVNSCIYKYITYLQSNDVDSILKVLDEDYKTVNSINLDNVYNYVEKLDGNNSFVSKKMYYEEISENYIKYYVYGYISKDTIDGKGTREDKYFIVNLDIDDQTFSLIPYNGNIFKEGLDE